MVDWYCFETKGERMRRRMIIGIALAMALSLCCACAMKPATLEPPAENMYTLEHESGTTFTFSAVDQQDCAIDVYASGEWVQTIVLPNEHVYGIWFADVNLDGFSDIVMEIGGTLNEAKRLCTYDPSIDGFALVEYDENLEFLAEFEVCEGYLKTWAKVSAGEVFYRELVWQGNTLVLETETWILLEEPIALDEYQHILRNDGGFYGVDGDRHTLAEYIAEDYGNTNPSDARFAIVDMDGDGIREVVLDIPPHDVLVLRYYSGEVYGYGFGVRALRDIKVDGSFYGSESASSGGCYRLAFAHSDCERIELAFYDGEDNEYRLHGEQSTEEEVDAFLNAKKEDVSWYVLSDENIQRYLSPLQ